MEYSIPRRIERLADIAQNLWWSWNPEVVRLFRHIDEDLWDRVNNNPVKFLRLVKRTRLNALLQDQGFLNHYDSAIAAFDAYMSEKNTWYARNHPDRSNEVIAYFSTEFGLNESLPIYAGGLGVLSGDHTKEASDLGLPFVGVGFIYQEGYFRQRISEDGWQEAYWEPMQYQDLPITPARDPNGDPVIVDVNLPGRVVHVQVWKIQVGRVPVYLMDTQIDSNTPEDRNLTARLYSSDLDIRITQEIVLGIGGVRALRRLGINPTVWHMNEGHSAFMTLERMAELVAAGKPFEAARAEVAASTVFTTHTPVPAGNEAFPQWLMEKYFPLYWERMGLNRDQFMDLAFLQREWGPTFSMPILALRFSAHRNGVSELHGRVSREMWHSLWPNRPINDVPIGHVTNGVHARSWIARRLALLFEKYLGSDWTNRLDDPDFWRGVHALPDEELWGIHVHLKRKLLSVIRARQRRAWMTTRIHPVQAIAGGALLDHNTLTIGFARRFATYKRANLLFSDFDRLLRMVQSVDMPVQFIFAGKAHPADEPGKQVIQELYRTIKKAEFAGRLAFVEDYDQNIARHMVQGVDVWLNTPRRPHEASGTSGMKAAMNGVLNASILDGWWPEGFNGENGWAIGTDREYDNEVEQDNADRESLFLTLEKDIIPLYYNRDDHNLPREWIRRMKDSIATLTPQFSTTRMLEDYLRGYYIPAMAEHQPTA